MGSSFINVSIPRIISLTCHVLEISKPTQLACSLFISLSISSPLPTLTYSPHSLLSQTPRNVDARNSPLRDLRGSHHRILRILRRQILEFRQTLCKEAVTLDFGDLSRRCWRSGIRRKRYHRGVSMG